MPSTVSLPKLTVTVVCRNHLYKGDALVLYHLVKHPSVGRVLVVPLTYTDPKKPEKSKPIHRNQTILSKGQSYFSNQAVPNGFLGYDLTAAVRMLGEEAKPASMRTSDIQDFLQKALDKRRADTTFLSRVRTVVKAGLSIDELGSFSRLPLELLPLETLNQSNLLVFEAHSRFLQNIHQLLPNPHYVNDPKTAAEWDSKKALPDLSVEINSTRRPLPPCRNVANETQLRQFMDDNHFTQVVLKKHHVDRGGGIYKIKKNNNGELQVAKVKKQGEDQSIRLQDLFKEGSILAMQWLDPSKGDVRVLGINSHILGALITKPDAGSEMANYAQGGTLHHYELNADERALAQSVLKALASKGQHFVGIDLLADSEGQRFVSEVNVGNAGGLMQINDYDLERRHLNNQEKASLGQRFAEGLIGCYRAQDRGRSR